SRRLRAGERTILFEPFAARPASCHRAGRGLVGSADTLGWVRPQTSRGDRVLGGEERAASARHPHPAGAADQRHWSCQAEDIYPGHGSRALHPVLRQVEERSGLDGAHLALHSFHPARNARRTVGHPAKGDSLEGVRARSGPNFAVLKTRHASSAAAINGTLGSRSCRSYLPVEYVANDGLAFPIAAHLARALN